MLVVDDDPDARQLLQLVFELEGAAVRTAASVDEAVAVLVDDPPDVVVSDICMPGRNGYDLIHTVRCLPGEAHEIPAVAVTAFPEREHRDRALAAGFQAHFSKPFNPYELVDVVAHLVGKAA